MKHVLFDLKGCLMTPPLDDEEYIKETLVEASKIANLELIKVDTHKFEPHGVTGYALLAESHISIHTWPENHIAKCDIFCCGEEAHPREAVQYLHGRFKSKEVRRWVCDRSSKILTVL